MYMYTRRLLVFIKRLLRDHRQQHPQSCCLYICGHITEDYDQETENRYPLFFGDACTRPFFLPRKKWPGNEATCIPTFRVEALGYS